MLDGFKEPTIPTAAEAEADSPWNPEEESPAGNPTQTRGGVTNYADHCWGCLPSEPWGAVTSRQLWCLTILADQRSNQLNSATYTLYMHLLIFPP